MKRISKENFGHLKTGGPVSKYTLKNKTGMLVSVLDFGVTITGIEVPDRTGKPGDVALGFNTLPGYLDEQNPYFGCIIGRVASRIQDHCIDADEKKWTLSQNHGRHHLHGGRSGFNKKIWHVETLAEQENRAGLVFTYRSPHLEEGYPGNLDVTAIMTLDDENILSIQYQAQTDRQTVVNLTNHTYFNLAGFNPKRSKAPNPLTTPKFSCFFKQKPRSKALTGTKESTCLDHILQINADRFTEPDKESIPTGKILEVKDLPLDFRSPQRVGNRIFHKGFPMEYTRGYDHNYIINKQKDSLGFAAKVHEPLSGRTLSIYTTQSCVQLYTGNFIPHGLKSKHNIPLKEYAGLCLETQGYPDATRHRQFESSLLNPGETYGEKTEYRFGTIWTKKHRKGNG